MSGTLEQSILDRGHNANVVRTVEQIFHILHDYIPRDCERKAKEDLYRAFTQSGLELTSRHEREQYEAVMKLCLDGVKYEEILKAGQKPTKIT